MSLFTIRPATLERSDQDLLIDFRDSQIQWLSATGSADQWGTQSVRESRPDVVEKATDWVKQSQKHAEWGLDWCRAFIAEVPSSGTSNGSSATDDAAVGDVLASTSPKTPVAALILTAQSPAYVRSILPQQGTARPFVYLSYLISNRAAGDLTKGAGAFLIAFAKEQVRQVGVERICLDCWSGNERKLVRYYESQGFEVLGDFVAVERDWPGTVMEMQLTVG